MLDSDSRSAQEYHIQSMSIMLGEEASERYPPEKPYRVCLNHVPVTVERLPYIPQPEDPLLDPGTARVNIAASDEAPNGTTQHAYAEKHAHQTVLQQHCAYFDQDGDGIISLTDTYISVRKWGWNIVLSLIVVIFIHGGLSYPSQRGWLPDPFFGIRIDNINKTKHGSDSTAYDNEGRFRPQAFEDLFAKYDRGNKGGLDRKDLVRAVNGQRLLGDLFGSVATAAEWFAVYLLLWPDDGILRKDDVRRVFDGSIFEQKALDYAANKELRRAKVRQRSPRAMNQLPPWSPQNSHVLGPLRLALKRNDERRTRRGE